MESMILVEGDSDRVAVETVAARLGRDFGAVGVTVTATGGITNFRRFVTKWVAEGGDVRMAGLYDAGEEHVVARALTDVGLTSNPDRRSLESFGFFVCVDDLEDELIRAMGADCVVIMIEREGESGSWRLFQNQPAQRGRDLEAQLRRFMGTKSGRKIRFAEIMARAIDLSRIPSPIQSVINYAFDVR
jgi:hypothetical protein